MSENTKNPVEEEDYKIILSFVKDFFSTRKLILTFVFLFLILGIINILVTPKVYTSKVTFITQSSGDSKSSGGLGGIAKLLGGGGASSNSSTSDIPSFLYPTIMESLAFQRKLYQTPIKLKEIDTLVSFGEYALKIEEPSLKSSIAKYTIGLPKLLFSSKKSTRVVVVKSIDSLEFEDGNELKIINSLKKKILLTTNDEDGTLEISASMANESIAAAQLARNAKKILQEEIIRYRVGQAQEKFDFIEKQYELRKDEFEKAQARLARYNDSNLFNITQSSLIRKRQLEGESNLLFTIFSDLESQRLSQSIKIQEDTPTFTTINPAIVPLKADNSNALKTLLMFGFLGFFFSALIYIFKVTRRYISILWKEV